MSDFVKKTVMGYKTVADNHYDPECTHVILTKREYMDLLQKISDAEQQVRSTECHARIAIGQAEHDAEISIQEAAAKAQKEIDEWKSALDIERSESAHQRYLNANLLRIAKERANADRKLKPKKEHTGYCVLFSAEKEYRYRENKRWKKVLLWETAIQSPYTVDLPQDLIRKQIYLELLRNYDSDTQCPLIDEIGIDGTYEFGSASYEAMIHDIEFCAITKGMNIIVQLHYRANYKIGYWEIVCLHTLPLAEVPKEWRYR